MIPLLVIAVILIVEAAGIGITAYSIYDNQQTQQAIIDSNNAVMAAIEKMPVQMEPVYYTFNYGIDFWTMLTECWVQIWLFAMVMFIAYMIVYPRKQNDQRGTV